jgi:hypothetical protein
MPFPKIHAPAVPYLAVPTIAGRSTHPSHPSEQAKRVGNASSWTLSSEGKHGHFENVLWKILLKLELDGFGTGDVE